MILPYTLSYLLYRLCAILSFQALCKSSDLFYSTILRKSKGIAPPYISAHQLFSLSELVAPQLWWRWIGGDRWRGGEGGVCLTPPLTPPSGRIQWRDVTGTRASSTTSLITSPVALPHHSPDFNPTGRLLLPVE